MDDRFYQLPTAQLGQGDILSAVPSLRILREPLTYIRKRPNRADLADLYVVGAQRTPTVRRFDPNGDDDYLATGQYGHAIVLSNACDWDNTPTAPVLLALVRPIETLEPGTRDQVERGVNGRFLKLPANDDPALETSYIDFARATAIRSTILANFERLLSPTPHLLEALYGALIYFFTRMEFDPAQAAMQAQKAIDEATERSS